MCKTAMFAGASALSLMLAGCSGATGMAESTPPPVPEPTPTPAPTPTPTPSPSPATKAVAIFPEISQSTTFAAVGIEANHRSPSALASAGFSVRYDEPSGLYVIATPRGALGGVYEYSDNTPNVSWWSGAVLGSNGDWHASVAVLKPTNPALQLTYTTLAQYDTSGMSPEPFGWVAFGTATPQSGVPIQGSATYSALARGSSIDGNNWIEGNASLAFNFGAGTLSGYFEPTYFNLGGMGEGYALGRYDFANTVYGTGSTTFSGQMNAPGFAEKGSFDGQFTGPNAEELMASWSAPFHDSIQNKDSVMFGVWVGAK